jgi:hypothetical protein
MTLLLERGIEASVARSDIPALREAGWLEGGSSAFLYPIPSFPQRHESCFFYALK